MSDATLPSGGSSLTDHRGGPRESAGRLLTPFHFGLLIHLLDKRWSELQVWLSSMVIQGFLAPRILARKICTVVRLRHDGAVSKMSFRLARVGACFPCSVPIPWKCFDSFQRVPKFEQSVDSVMLRSLMSPKDMRAVYPNRKRTRHPFGLLFSPMGPGPLKQACQLASRFFKNQE